MKRLVIKFAHSLDAHTFVVDERVVEDEEVPDETSLSEEAWEAVTQLIEAWIEVEDIDE